MERFTETQYWFVVAAVVLIPMFAFWIIEIISWLMRCTLWRRPLWRHLAIGPPSGALTGRDEPASVAAPPG